MARIRTIKPDFFTSLTIADLPLTARLTFVGLWTHVDDEGRCVDEPRLVRAAVWPLDDRTAADVETDLTTLHDASLIRRYQVAGRRFLAVTNWLEHQRIDKPKPSKHPGPEQGSPPPPMPNRDSNGYGPTSGNTDFEDASANDPGHVGDASATRPGRVPVGTGNREQGTGRGTGRESAGASEPDNRGAADPQDQAKPLSHIDAAWQPSEHDYAAAATDVERLGADAVQQATAKFRRHHQAKATTARDFGPLWVTWLARERAPMPPQSGVVVPFQPAGRPGGTDGRVTDHLSMIAAMEERQAQQ